MFMRLLETPSCRDRQEMLLGASFVWLWPRKLAILLLMLQVSYQNLLVCRWAHRCSPAQQQHLDSPNNILTTLIISILPRQMLIRERTFLQMLDNRSQAVDHILPLQKSRRLQHLPKAPLL